MTSPAFQVWPSHGSDFRRSEVTASLGYGDELWKRVAEDVLLWAVKTRSGFEVDAEVPVSPGQRVQVTAHLFGITVVEPVEVVTVVQETNRCGYSYRTLPGHPVDGEEAFIAHRDGDEVLLTIRSLTRAARQQPWRVLFPFLLVAQRITRRRYLRALH